MTIKKLFHIISNKSRMAPDLILQFDPADIQHLAAQYNRGNQQDTAEQDIVDRIAPQVKASKSITVDDFRLVCNWKTPRSKSRVRENSPGFIHEVFQLALSAKEERLRIELFTLLKGVSYPTASVFLHFFHENPYPIIDFRALEALGAEQPGNYSFDFWWAYVTACRKLAQESAVDMRTLDRALWQWSRNGAQQKTSEE